MAILLTAVIAGIVFAVAAFIDNTVDRRRADDIAQLLHKPVASAKHHSYR